MKKLYFSICSVFTLLLVSSSALYAQAETSLQIMLDKDYAVVYGTEKISGTLLNTGATTSTVLLSIGN